MQEARQMFRTANKVTRPEKALILGFMAGARGWNNFLLNISFNPKNLVFNYINDCLL